MENVRHSKGLEWCPEADLNHRHADFQSRAITGCSTASGEKAVKPDAGNQTLSSVLSNDRSPVDVAADWLAAHRGECTGALIPQVRDRFSLTNLEAIEALKRSHVLRMARAM